MTLPNELTGLDYSGIAKVADLDISEFKPIARVMESEQEAFLAKAPLFRSPEYRWPHDALHNWSRIWEYPYAYHHLSKWLKGQPATGIKIADVGSGVVFFPFALAKLGPTVICTDTDPIAERDINRAARVVGHGPGSVEFRPTDGVRLQFDDAELDGLYCISVLEHVADIPALAKDMARVLKPGGILVLTIDLDFRGDQEIGPDRYAELIQVLDEYFTVTAPYRVVRHPAEILRSTNGPYGIKPLTGAKEAWRSVKQQVIKPLFGRAPRPWLPFDLAVEGFCLTRR